jgi:hypothetical protein
LPTLGHGSLASDTVDADAVDAAAAAAADVAALAAVLSLPGLQEGRRGRKGRGRVAGFVDTGLAADNAVVAAVVSVAVVTKRGPTQLPIGEPSAAASGVVIFIIVIGGDAAVALSIEVAATTKRFSIINLLHDRAHWSGHVPRG